MDPQPQAMPPQAPPQQQQPQPQQQPQQGEPESQPDTDKLNLDLIMNSVNLAESLDDDELGEIGEEAVEGYEDDLQSRQSWMDQNEEWMKLALQVREDKTYPWPKAANIKYPMLTTAALQFVSRAYSSLVPSFDVVKAKPIGSDPQGQAMDIAEKISTHMSYQIFYEMDDWEESMDKLCLVLPIVGCAFKKTYYSNYKEKNCSELVLPKDLVVNYWAKSLEQTTRKTHQFYLTPNDIIERQRMGLFMEYEDCEFGSGRQSSGNILPDQTNSGLVPPANDKDVPRLILEQHAFLDLDDDDYKEPYVITVDYETKKVLRIVPRFRMKDVIYHPKNPGKIARIKPTEYFTKFSFIPNPDGGFYDVGFGLLLGSLNESANTLINQLVDAGTISNLQPGFLAKGLRIGKSGEMRFQPGEWKWVNNTYEDLKKGIFPLPVREPSNVLFQLLGMIVQSGKELASIAEIFTGKMPGQNTPASTTMATIEQGLKVFTSIYKRIYRALGKEFEKLFELNQIYLPPGNQGFSYEKDGFVTDQTISKELYQAAKVKIVPAADPNMVTETQKLLQITAMMELSSMGHLNPEVVTRRSLEAHGVSGIAELMNVPPPQPPLEVQLKQMELADKDKDRQLQAMQINSENQKRQSEIMLNMAKAKQLGDEQGALMLEAQLEQEKASNEIQMKWMDLMFKKQDHQMEMQHTQATHNLDMQVKKVTAAQDIHSNALKNDAQIAAIKAKAAAKPATPK